MYACVGIALLAVLVVGILMWNSDHYGPALRGEVSQPKHSVMVQESVNVAAVLRYIEEGYNGRNEEVLRSAFAPGFVQHTPYIPDGAEGFIGFYREEFERYPDPHMRVHRVFVEGDFVVLHSHLLFDRSDFGDDFAEGFALIGMYRLDDDSRIAEYWGIAQPISPSVTSVNGNSLFDGAINKRAESIMTARERRNQYDPEQDPGGRDAARDLQKKMSKAHRDMNRQVVLEYGRLLFDEGDFDSPRLRELVADDLIQHNPIEPNGLDELIEFFKPIKQQFPDVAGNVKRTVADGDFVVTQVHYAPLGSDDYTRGPYSFDIYRVVDGQIVEHWDTVGDLSQVESRRVEGNTNPVF